MSRRLYMLTDQQMERIAPHLPKPRGWPRVDDKLVLSGIIHVRKNGIPWDQAPGEYGKWATLYRRFVRWTRGGVFLRILMNVAMDEAELAMFDSTCCKAHRTAASLKAGPAPDGKHEELPEGQKRKIGMTKGGRNTKIHAICDEKGRPMSVELTAGNVNDCTTAISLIDRMPAGAKALLADKGYDTDKIREKLEEKEIEACIPSKVNRTEPIPHDEEKYKRRQEIERMFGRIKDWRSIAMRYDRCHDLFMGAVILAIIVMFWV